MGLFFWEATHSCGYALREQGSSRELGLVPAFLGLISSVIGEGSEGYKGETVVPS